MEFGESMASPRTKQVEDRQRSIRGDLIMTPEFWQQVKEVFHSALALPPDERAGFLDKVCHGQDSLRKEIESLISSHQETGSFIDSPAYRIAAELFSDQQIELKAEQKIGRYKILSLLGKGGMGEVYLAEDTSLRRLVALKILPADFTANSDRLARFEREAFAASSLNHPNILTIYEIGAEDGHHFIATEFIDGESLRQHMKDQRLELREVLEISIQVASALAAAHAARIVHRDIKPENIMLRRDALIKVLDFGLAKLSEKRETNFDTEAETKMLVNTAPGVVMGTPGYMSPEQARGNETDARTDIWSLGVVLYEMLAGRLPFAGETASDAIAAILKTEPAPVQNFNQAIPAELEQIVTKTLAKDREERYQTAKDLLVDLKRLKRQIEIQTEIVRAVPSKKPSAAQIENATQILAAHPTSSAEYIASEIKQHKRNSIVALSVLLLAVIGFGYWFFVHRLSNRTPIESIAVLPFVNASSNSDIEYLSDGMTESLISSLSQLPKLSVKARSSVFRYKGKDVSPQTVGNELSVQAVLLGRVIQRGDLLTLSLELVDARTENVIWSEQYNRKQTDLVALQSEIARDVSNKLKQKLTGEEEQKLAKNYTANPEAYQLYLKGRFYWNQRTETGLKKGIEYFQQAIRKSGWGLSDSSDRGKPVHLPVGCFRSTCRVRLLQNT